MTKTLEQKAEEYAVNWTKPRLPEAEIHALTHAYLAGYKQALEDAAEEVSLYAQGFCEVVNMGDATVDEVAPYLLAMDILRKQIRALGSDHGKE